MPGDYSNMRETARHRIQQGNELRGLCCYNQRLFTVERRDGSDLLCMYWVTGQGATLLDTVTLKVWTQYPERDDWYSRVDGHRQEVYIPAGYRGLSVVSWEDNRLTTQRSLECVGWCWGVGVMSSHTLCVCDWGRGSVSVVSVPDDTVTATLGKPEEVRDKKPRKIAVLGDSILVWYEDRNLVVYENGVSSPGTMVNWVAGLQSVWGMSSDGVSRFLVCDGNSKTVFILDASGKLCDKIKVDTGTRVFVRKEVCDSTMVDGKLWVGCYSGDIVVMSL